MSKKSVNDSSLEKSAYIDKIMIAIKKAVNGRFVKNGFLCSEPRENATTLKIY